MKKYEITLSILVLYATKSSFASPTRRQRPAKETPALRKRQRMDNDTKLFMAVASGNLENVAALLNAGCNPRITNHNGQTPLHLAAQLGHARIASLLIRAGAIPCTADNNGQSPLHNAVKSGDLRVTYVLLEAYALPNATDLHNFTPLHFAAQRGDRAIVAALVNAKASIEVVNEDGYTPLQLALASNHVKVVELLLDAGAKFDQKNYLRLAILSGCEKMVATLIKHGADPNESDRHDGKTPLHAAACSGRTAAVRTLLIHGANPNKLDKYGRTPLHAASFNGYNETILVLLRGGADPNKSGCREDTALHTAIGNSKFETSRILIRAGAEIMPVCSDWPLEHYCFLSTACGKRYIESCMFLQQLISQYIRAGAKNGNSILHQLFGKSYDQNKRLLESVLHHPDIKLCDVTQKNKDGHHVLHVAAIHNPSLLEHFFKQLFLSKPRQIQTALRRAITPSGDTLDSLATPSIRRLLGKQTIIPNASWTPLMHTVHRMAIADAESAEKCRQMLRQHKGDLAHVTETFDSALSATHCERVKTLIREEIQAKNSAVETIIVLSRSKQS